MKIALSILIIILAVFACGCTTTAPVATPTATQGVTPVVTTNMVIPNLTGTWTGTTIGHTEAEGFREHNTPQFIITAQKGQAFTGNKTYTRADGKVYPESFSGVISSDGKIYIADHNSGLTIGDLSGPDKMELKYIEDGDDAQAFIILLTRQKT